MIVAFLTFEALKEALGAGEHKRLALQQQQQLQRTSQQQQQQAGSRHHLPSGRGDAAGWIGSGEGEGEEERRRRRRGEELAAGDEREQLEHMRLAENAEEV